MVERNPARKGAHKSARSSSVTDKASAGFTAEERAAMKSRYATLGFNDDANLDEGAMWPTSFALKELTAAEEARIAALVKKAVS